MKKVMITGAAGLLGQYLCKFFAENCEVIGTYHQTLPPFKNIILKKVDLSQKTEIERVLDQNAPDVIINTAGLTSVDECEMHSQIAHELNVTCTQSICGVIKNSNTKFIQISTDHLFSGTRANYSEEDQTEPLNVYAKTKLLSEIGTLKLPSAVVIRTNFYGGHTDKKISFSTWIFNELSNNRKINMFDDVFFTPISVCGLADNLELIMKSELKGVYNVVGEERLSKYEYALKLANVFELPKDLISKTIIENLHLKAKRPHDMSLSTVKIKQKLFNYIPEDVIQGLLKIQRRHLI